MLAIRSAVPRTFVLGIKINAADYVATDDDNSHKQKPTLPDALDHIRTIACWGLIDFIEISGGDYEKLGTIVSPLAFHVLTLHNKP